MASRQQVKEFFEKYGPIAVELCAGSGVFPSVALAQAALETGYAVSKPYNNMFGHKAPSGWTGKVYSTTTREHLNGKDVVFKGTGKAYPNRVAAIKDGANVQTIFKAYDTEKDAWKDYVSLIKRRFSKALQAANPFEQIKAIKDGGYATGAKYVEDVSSIIRSNQLEDWDKKKSSKRIGRNKAKWLAVAAIVAVTAIIILLVWKRKKIIEKLKTIKILNKK